MRISDALLRDPLHPMTHVVYDGGDDPPIVVRQDLSVGFLSPWTARNPIPVPGVVGFAGRIDATVSMMLALAGGLGPVTTLIEPPTLKSRAKEHHEVVLDTSLFALVAAPLTAQLVRDRGWSEDVPILESPDVDDGIVLSLPDPELLGIIPVLNRVPSSAVVHTPQNVARWHLSGVRFEAKASSAAKHHLKMAFMVESVLDS